MWKNVVLRGWKKVGGWGKNEIGDKWKYNLK